MDFIEWSWNAVDGVSGYDVQYSANEAFTEEDETIARTAEEISYRREGLEAGASAFLRVRAAAGMGEERVTSDWSTHVTGMTAEPEPELPPAPAAPANLRLKDRGSNFIEWEWDEVSGADGYESQFSTDGISFVALQPHAGAGNTSRRVSNLAAETAGHLQVRSYTGSGTGADTVRGDWSASDQQATDEPPAAVALDAPDNFESSDPDENSIVLEWDEVDDADYYEVEQSDDGGSSWDDAECGDSGSNEVDGTECIASGLDEGTDYEFRVRAIPADDDDAHTTGAWSGTDGTTEGTQPTTTPGGMGTLNIRWANNGTNNSNIVFIWDRQADAKYETFTLEDATEITNDDPCEDVTYTSRGAATSLDVPTTVPGTARGLCVRTEGSSDASFAWGISPPEEPDVGTPEVNDKNVTTALEWSDVDLKAAFDYTIRLATDPERPATDNEIGTGSAATSRSVQSACDAGTIVDEFTPDIDLLNRSVSVDSGLAPHMGYLLCIQASNGAGTSAWAVSIQGDTADYGSDDNVQETFTRPAAPPTPTSAGSTSIPAANNENEKLAPAWEIGTRGVDNVPRNAADFNLMIFESMTSSAASLRVADCGTAAPDDYAAVTLSDQDDVSDGLSGFEVEVAEANGIERLGYNRKVYLCAQAESGTDNGHGIGPWNISPVFTVAKSSTSLSTKSDSVTATAATITIKNWNRDWWYKTNAANAQCESASGAEPTLQNLTASTSYRVTAWDDSACEGNSLGSTSFRTKAQ